MELSERTGLLSVGINLLLVVMKYNMVVLAGTVALLVDSSYSSYDVISSAIMFEGMKISKRKSKGIKRFHGNFVGRMRLYPG
jgi:divalent metal cation (Fe/Co/Zn/Cd) transporter